VSAKALVDCLYWIATNKCTLHCMHCSGVFGVGDHVEEQSIQKQIRLIKNSEITFNTLQVLGGEPLLAIQKKHIKQLRPYFKKIVLITNGTLLPKRKWVFKSFDEIHLSVYGTKLVDKSVKRMGSEHDAYWDEMLSLLAKKNNLFLMAAVMNFNLLEIPKLAKLSANAGKRLLLVRYLGKKYNPADWKVRGLLDKLKEFNVVFKNACFGPYYNEKLLCPAGVERLCYNNYFRGVTPCLFIDKVLGEDLSLETYKSALVWRKQVQLKAYADNSCADCKFLAECGAGCMAQNLLHSKEPFCHAKAISEKE